MNLLYNISIYIYIFIVFIISIFNKKAKRLIKSKKGVLNKIKSEINDHNDIVWFHCSSLGEFEQGKILIEKYGEKYANHKILLTFFSPSGYDVKKNYDNVNWVFHLPFDTKVNAQEFIRIVKPKKAIFIKYDFWFNYMKELKKQDIPLYFVATSFRSNQIFFKFSWFAKQLKNVKTFFLQEENSKILLKKINIETSFVVGDTRFDSVYKNKLENIDHNLINIFSKKRDTIIFGSIWSSDEHLLLKYIKQHKEFNFILVPHELNNLEELQKKTSGVFFSELHQKNTSNNILIIDQIGILASIYKYAKIAYIGGGFNNGIHNILEAIVFEVPVIFGPNYTKSNEAKDLIKLGVAKSVKNYSEFQEAINQLKKVDKNIMKNYIEKNIGASKKIIAYI